MRTHSIRRAAALAAAAGLTAGAARAQTPATKPPASAEPSKPAPSVPAGQSPASNPAPPAAPGTGPTPPAANQAPPAAGDQAGAPPPSGETTTARPGEGQSATVAPEPVEQGKTHTVTKGDTLWDLSQKYLSNPWYWPKIWSQNPQVENPHWIYPGQKLHITKGPSAAAPAEAEAEKTPEAGPVADAGEPSDVRDLTQRNNLTEANTPDLAVARGNVEGGHTEDVAATGRLAYRQKAIVRAMIPGLISKQQIAESGSLDGSFSERQYLASFDLAYAQFPKGQTFPIGQKLIIYRTLGELKDPKTHETLAIRTRTLADAKVVDLHGSTYTVEVGSTREEIERGDLVRVYSDMTREVAPRPNAKSVDALVVTGVNPDLDHFGQLQEVFIDRGSVDGVEEGNTFNVIRQGDGLNIEGVSGLTQGAAARHAVPEEVIGSLLVVDVRDHVSTAVVVSTSRELEPGDRAQMRPAR